MDSEGQPLVFVNPEITVADGHQVYQEGCLSVPNIFADVTRANSITVKAWGRDGQPFELQADGLLAIFFFVAGLELKREFVAGDLRDPRRAAVPIAAAFGGVAIPALIYVVVNLGHGH